jgi:hypothetical protein
MKLSQKAAYIKGLLKGIEIGEDKKILEILNEVIDLSLEITESIESLKFKQKIFSKQIDIIDNDLAEIENEVFYENEKYYQDSDDCCHSNDNCRGDEFCHCHEHSAEKFKLECPECNKTIEISEEKYNIGRINCPFCEEPLEFAPEDTCDCGCNCEDKRYFSPKNAGKE